MADFSEMLNGILSNPQAMQQMMALAQSLGLQGQGGQPQQSAPTPPPPPPQLPQQPSQPDPMQLLQGFLQMSKQMGGDERQLALFQALKPFVRPDRAEKLDRAIRDNRGIPMDHNEDYTVAEWCRLWFETYSKPVIRPNTAKNYRNII